MQQIILNLADLDSSDIKYEKAKYSDGQVNIFFDKDSMKKVPEDSDVFILTKFNSYDDLFYLLGATDILKFSGVENISVGFTCFLAQRSDQRFIPLQSFDLQILTDIVNSQNYKSVMVNGPHSQVLPGLLKRCRTMPEDVFFKFVQATMETKFNTHSFTLVSPDAGAYKRLYVLAERHGFPLVAANKVRVKGEPIVTVTGDVKDKVCVIMDDLCDGGRTFISLASQLKELGASKIILAVVHGLFSYGLDVLKDGNIDHVICTNSISNINLQHDGINEKDYTDFITQLDLIKRNG